MALPDDLRTFYDCLDTHAARNGLWRLGEVKAWAQIPRRGVYYFFDESEPRTGSGSGLRVVRVGTHGLISRSRSTLAGRLRQHRGSKTGGNHRGSIFRLLVGQTLLKVGLCSGCATWGVKKDALARLIEERALGADWRTKERETEDAVTAYLGRLVFTFIAIDDEPGPESSRGYVERNSIALLSSYDREPVDPPSSDWLGKISNRGRIPNSGLWNYKHVEERHEPAFLTFIARAS